MYSDKKDRLFNIYEEFLPKIKILYQREIKDPGCLEDLKILNSDQITKGIDIVFS